MLKKSITKILSLSVIILLSCRSESTGPADIIVSVQPFSPKISINSPQQYAIWKAGNTYTIKWKTSSSISRINIELYKKSYFRRLIANNILNEEYFEWKIPSDIPRSHHYKLKIENSNNSDDYSISDVFYILE